MKQETTEQTKKTCEKQIKKSSKNDLKNLEKIRPKSVPARQPLTGVS